MKTENQILLQAIFQSARTTIDGAWRISFDIDDSQGDLVADLVKLKNKKLFVVISTRIDNDDFLPIDIKFDV